MSQPDLDGATAFAVRCLEEVLPAALCYHCTAHTREEVQPAAEHLAGLESLDEHALLLLKTV